MLKFYRTLKLIVVVLAVCTVFLVLFYENFRDDRKPAQAGSFFHFYDKAREIALYDPYDREVLARVRQASADLKKSFFNIASSVSNLITRPDFYNNVFIFMVSRKADGISSLIRQEFTNIPSFTDLVILDKNRDVIYKYGNASFVTGDFTASNEGLIRVLDNTVAVFGNYRDETLDSEILIIALFDTGAAAAQLKDFPYPAFLIVSNRIYRNTGALPDNLKEIREDIKSEREYPSGFSVVRTYNIIVNQTYIGTLGVTYPARSIPSILLILLKVLLFVFVIVALVTGDNFIENRIRGRDKPKEKTSARTVVRKSKDKNPEQDDADTEAQLDWFEHYVQGQEPGHEKKKVDKP